MVGIENFLSQLLKDKIPRYHGIYCRTVIFLHIYQYFTESFSIFIMQSMSDEKYLLT